MGDALIAIAIIWVSLLVAHISSDLGRIQEELRGIKEALGESKDE